MSEGEETREERIRRIAVLRAEVHQLEEDVRPLWSLIAKSERLKLQIPQLAAQIVGLHGDCLKPGCDEATAQLHAMLAADLQAHSEGKK